MTSYPKVLGELETLRLVASGRSIARYGDGEFKMARGHSDTRPFPGIKSQQWHPDLQQRLLDILQDSGECMVGIPNIHSSTPKAEFWNKHATFADLLVDRPYVSSFITRPDSAPWINTPEYWDLLESIWRDRPITLVTGSGKSLKAADLIGAGEVREIQAPRQHAWAEYASLLDRVGTPNHTVIVCLGPTATVMAHDLCKRGVHCCDLGHVALFLRKVRRGELVTEVTDAERVMQ